MNSLSWFLYAIDVIGNVKALLGIFLVVTAIAWAVLNIGVLITEGDLATWPDYKKWWVRGVCILVAGGFVVAVLPSTNTMYAIAASQVGEQVVKSEAVQGIASDATKALQQWIKKQVEPGEKK